MSNITLRKITTSEREAIVALADDIRDQVLAFIIQRTKFDHLCHMHLFTLVAADMIDSAAASGVEAWGIDAAVIGPHVKKLIVTTLDAALDRLAERSAGH